MVSAEPRICDSFVDVRTQTEQGTRAVYIGQMLTERPDDVYDIWNIALGVAAPRSTPAPEESDEPAAGDVEPVPPAASNRAAPQALAVTV